jgi:hypothetical protein
MRVELIEDGNTWGRRLSGILIVLLLGMCTLFTVSREACAQPATADTLKGRVDATADTATDIQKRLSAAEAVIRELKKIKLSGFVQARYEHHEDAISGPQFGTASSSTKNQGKLLDRFFVRRGRLKVAYQANPKALGFLSLDGSSSGVVLKDAYISLTESWSGIVLTLGQFKWLFGYEEFCSTPKRDFPERVRWCRTLFPGDRDRGLKAERSFPLGTSRNLTLQAGIYNGNGIDDKAFGAADPNKAKDLSVRATCGLGRVDIGLSGYWGRQFNPCDSAIPRQHPSTTDKIRYGADAQFYYKLPSLGAGSIKMEGVIGKEPRSDSAAFRSGDTTRNVAGFDLVWAQKLTRKIEWISRFDYYDPNRDIARDYLITYGLGLVYLWDDNSKIRLVYEIPKTVQNDAKDNILTLEFLYAL